MDSTQRSSSATTDWYVKKTEESSTRQNISQICPLFYDPGCPKPIENLMVGCWDPSPVNRPSMEYVVQVMRTLCEYFPGAEEPLEITKNDEAESYVIK